MTDKRLKVTFNLCNHHEATKKRSFFVEYIILFKRHLSFAATHLQKNSNIKPVYISTNLGYVLHGLKLKQT